jgi:hypothetical protein
MASIRHQNMQRCLFTVRKRNTCHTSFEFFVFLNRVFSNNCGPEYLLIGKKGEGRTSILEALLGHHIAGSCTHFENSISNETNDGYYIGRPLFVHLLNNPKRDTARIVIKKICRLRAVVSQVGQ